MTGYKYEPAISKKKRELYKRGYLRGPYYHINLNAVGKNEIFDIYADIHFDTEYYDLVFNLIKAIGCWRWIFPALQGDRFFVYFQCNYHAQIAQLLNVLKKEGIIEHTFYSSQNQWIVENPDFFGREIISYDNLFSECPLPEMKYSHQKIEKTWRQLEIRIMGYLQVKSVDIGTILKYERDFYGYIWKKSQIKYAIQKLVEYHIAERKHYNVAPYPRDTCFSSLLFVLAETPSKTVQVMENLGKSCRVYRAYTLAGETGIMLCWASVRNIPEFLSAFENIDEVWVRAYQLKSHTTRYMGRQSFDVSNFDLQTQRWIFPYHEYEKNIEHLLENHKH